MASLNEVNEIGKYTNNARCELHASYHCHHRNLQP